MKRVTSLALVIVILVSALSMSFTSFAEDDDDDKNKTTANIPTAVAPGGTMTGTMLDASSVTSADKDALKKLRVCEVNAQTGAASSGLRTVAFTIVKWLGTAIDSLADGINKVYNLLSFSSSDKLKSLVDRYGAVYKALFIVSLVFLGIYMLLGKNGNQLNTVNCILIIIVIIVGMPLITSKFTDLTVSGTEYAQGQWTSSGEFDSVAGQKVKDNIVDLKLVDSKGVSSLKKGEPFNQISLSNDVNDNKSWRYININSIMDWNASALSGNKLKENYWGYELSDDDSVIPQDTGFMGIGRSYYYRYQVLSWFNIIGSLLVIVVVLFFVFIRCARLIFEVAMAQVYIPLVAITDIASGQRIKETLKNFFVLFFTIFLCIALVGVYFVGNAYIDSLPKDDWPILLKILLQFALAWAVIDGPDILQRVLGVDAGIKNGWQFVMGARAVGSMATGAGRFAAGAAMGAGKTGAKVGQKVGGQISKHRNQNANSGGNSNIKDNISGDKNNAQPMGGGGVGSPNESKRTTVSPTNSNRSNNVSANMPGGNNTMAKGAGNQRGPRGFDGPRGKDGNNQNIPTSNIPQGGGNRPSNNRSSSNNISSNIPSSNRSLNRNNNAPKNIPDPINPNNKKK